MSITLDKDRTLELLHAAVDERGQDYVYPRAQRGDRCYYVHDDKPDCLVAEVLHRAGVTIDQLITFGDHAEQGVASAAQLIDALRAQDILEVGVGTRMVLVDVQNAQDGGDTWGEALTIGESTATLF